MIPQSASCGRALGPGRVRLIEPCLAPRPQATSARFPSVLRHASRASFLSQEHVTSIFDQPEAAGSHVGDADTRHFARRHVEARAQGPVGPRAAGRHILVYPNLLGVVDGAPRCTVLVHFLDKYLPRRDDYFLLACHIVIIWHDGKFEPQVRRGRQKGSS